MTHAYDRITDKEQLRLLAPAVDHRWFEGDSLLDGPLNVFKKDTV